MRIILYGLIIGIFVSLTGGGGASLYLGVLTSQLGMATATAVPTSLFIAIPALFFGFLTQLKVNNVDLKIGNMMIISALPGILFGTIISKYMNEHVYNWGIGILLIVMGILILIKFFKKNKNEENKVNGKQYSKKLAILLGTLSGLMVGLGGLSGGATTISGLTLMGLPVILASGTTTYVLWVMSVIGFISHLFTSKIAWFSGIYLMIGAVVGSIITPLLINKFNPEKYNKLLTPLLGCLIIYFGISMILK